MIARLVFILLFVLQPIPAVSSDESKCLSSRQQIPGTSVEIEQRYFEQRFSEAEILRQAAAGAGAEWLKTESLLVQAQQEAARGNWNPAFELTAKACQQAELALQQAKHESRAWKKRVIK